MNSLLSVSADNTPSLAGFLDTLISWCLNTGLKLVIALVVMVVSFRIVNLIARKIERRGSDARFDKTLMRTLAYIVKVGAKIVILTCLIGYVGIDTSGLAALVASLGVCAGLAVNGALSNLAGGVLIIVTRPFKIDDYIEAQGISGTVEDIHIVCTKIRTPDNKVVYVPNGTLSNGNIINYSEKPTRRVDFSFSVAYDSDVELVKNIVRDILISHELTLDEPECFVRVSEHGESAIVITARVWCESGDYWTVNYDVIESVKRAFDENRIKIPYSQLDVHVKND